MRSRLTDNRGTTLIEYGFVLILVAFVLIVMIRGFGMSTNNQYSSINQKVKSASE
jgi:Flp pilus assembly pilin Flp